MFYCYTLHLLLTRYGRADAMPLGKFCVNLTNCPPSTSYASLLHYLISNLVTQVTALITFSVLQFSPFLLPHL